MLGNRTKDWLEFSDKVAGHIEDYTIPQYGDRPNDLAEQWKPEDCIANIKRYAARFGSNSRAGQEKLDLLKIAHYAQLAYLKLEQAEEK